MLKYDDYILHKSASLWVRWLLVGACSAVHASFGTESQSHTLLAFLMPEQQHHRFTHVLELPECLSHFHWYPTISSTFHPFPSPFYPLPATSRHVKHFAAFWSMAISKQLQQFRDFFFIFPVIPETFINILKIHEISLFYFTKGPWLGFRSHSAM